MLGFGLTAFSHKVVTLENLHRKKTISTVLDWFAEEAPWYDVEAFVLDNIMFGLPGSRERFYIVAVDICVVALLKPLTSWVDDFRKIVAEMTVEKWLLDASLLPDGCESSAPSATQGAGRVGDRARGGEEDVA
jgi:site-specific DNA-cytosine methylase